MSTTKIGGCLSADVAETINQKWTFAGGLEVSAGQTASLLGTIDTGLTAKSVVYTDANQELAVLTPTDGQLVIGSTGNIPVAAGLTGTANQLVVANGAGTVTLSTPQDTHTAATPQFARLGLGQAADGTAVLSAGGLAILGIGEGGVTAATGDILRAPDVATGGAGNVAGADLTIAAGLGTGTGDAGQIIFRTPRVAAAGDNPQTLTTLLVLDEEEFQIWHPGGSHHADFEINSLGMLEITVSGGGGATTIGNSGGRGAIWGSSTFMVESHTSYGLYLQGGTECVINDFSYDCDFRIETSNVTNAVFLNAGEDKGEFNFLLDEATGNEAALTLNYTTNKATSGNDTGLVINQTDTLSPGTSLLADFQVGSASQFSVSSVGAVSMDSGITVNVDGDDANSVLSGAGETNLMFWDAGYDSIGIGTATLDATGRKVLAQFLGTAPSGGLTDAFQMYAGDIAAGECAPHFVTEHGDVVKLYQQAHIADAPGDTAANNATTINAILVALENTGLLANA